MDRGHAVHVGTQSSYLALYTPDAGARRRTFKSANIGLNHIALVVDDLKPIEERVKNEGFESYNFGDYEPGVRFYFRDYDNIEYEIVSYSPCTASFKTQVTRVLADMAKFGALYK